MKCVEKVAKLVVVDGPCSWREALQREFVRTVRDLQGQVGGGRVSFGACFQRPPRNESISSS